VLLQRVNPDKPFVLRVDASRYAIGATLEQVLDEDRAATIEDVRARKTVPVAFMSRKLASNQRNWVPREQETYAIILALKMGIMDWLTTGVGIDRPPGDRKLGQGSFGYALRSTGT
jgi:hypothetical protein